jgi:hypothetical protein
MVTLVRTLTRSAGARQEDHLGVSSRHKELEESISIDGLPRSWGHVGVSDTGKNMPASAFSEIQSAPPDD